MPLQIGLELQQRSSIKVCEFAIEEYPDIFVRLHYLLYSRERKLLILKLLQVVYHY